MSASSDSLGIGCVVARLRELGFDKRDGLILTLPLGSKNVLGWVGLNKAAVRGQRGASLLHPVMGVRHQDVEKLVAELRDDKYYRYFPATVSYPLRYVMPSELRRDWIVTGGVGDIEIAEDLACSVEQYGLEFMRGAVELPGLIELLRAGRGPDYVYLYRLPVAYLLAGDVDSAVETVDAVLASSSGAVTEAAVEFRSFAHRFRSRVLG